MEEGPEVAPSEPITRFLFFSRHIRADGFLRPDPLMPFPYAELSVSVLDSRTPEQLWGVGDGIGTSLPVPRPCLGRTDISAQAFYAQALTVVRQATPVDPSHANVEGWPAAREQQKQLALNIIEKERPFMIPRPQRQAG